VVIVAAAYVAVAIDVIIAIIIVVDFTVVLLFARGHVVRVRWSCSCC